MGIPVIRNRNGTRIVHFLLHRHRKTETEAADLGVSIQWPVVFAKGTSAACAGPGLCPPAHPCLVRALALPSPPGGVFFRQIHSSKKTIDFIWVLWYTDYNKIECRATADTVPMCGRARGNRFSPLNSLWEFDARLQFLSGVPLFKYEILIYWSS